MNKRGSVLMISLWIVAILSIFALGLGHRCALNLKLARYQKDRLKAYYLAKAGIEAATVELDKDLNNYDSLDEAWSTGRDPAGKALFEKVEIKTGSGETFTVNYPYDREIYLCMADEERKININSAPEALLLGLLKESGMGEAEAPEFVAYIRLWRGDGIPGISLDDEPYKDFKKASFSVPQELVILLEIFYKNKSPADYREKAQESFSALKGLITVYGDNLNCPLNINTVSEETLSILATSVAKSDDERNGVSKVVQAIMNLRNEKKYFETTDDIKISLEPGAEEGLFSSLKERLIVKSSYFRIESSGNVGAIARKITAIYNKEGKKPVYWHEN